MNEGLVFLGTFFGGAAAVAAYAAHLPPNNGRISPAARLLLWERVSVLPLQRIAARKLSQLAEGRCY